MNYRWTCNNINDLPKISVDILSKCGKKIAFFGELGAGKTTLIRQLCIQIGVKEATGSPSFSILNEYTSGKNKIFHFDFYRISKIEEIYDLGYEEYLYSNDYVFIEWPDKMKFLLPDFFCKIKIETPDNQMRVFNTF